MGPILRIPGCPRVFYLVDVGAVGAVPGISVGTGPAAEAGAGLGAGNAGEAGIGEAPVELGHGDDRTCHLRPHPCGMRGAVRTPKKSQILGITGASCDPGGSLWGQGHSWHFPPCWHPEGAAEQRTQRRHSLTAGIALHDRVLQECYLLDLEGNNSHAEPGAGFGSKDSQCQQNIVAGPARLPPSSSCPKIWGFSGRWGGSSLGIHSLDEFRCSHRVMLVSYRGGNT